MCPVAELDSALLVVWEALGNRSSIELELVAVRLLRASHLLIERVPVLCRGVFARQLQGLSRMGFEVAIAVRQGVQVYRSVFRPSFRFDQGAVIVAERASHLDPAVAI